MGRTCSRGLFFNNLTGRLVNMGRVTDSHVLLVAISGPNVITSHFQALSRVEIVIPRTDPSRLTAKLVDNLFLVGRVDVGET